MAYTDTPDSIVGALTDMGRMNLARVALGELSFKVVGFSVGRDGYQMINPVKITPVNPSNTDLVDHTFPYDIGPSSALSSFAGPSSGTKKLDILNPAIAMPFVLPANQQLTKATWVVTKTGTPIGGLQFKIVRDDSGLPSTDPADIIWSQNTTISGFPAGSSNIDMVPISSLTPDADNYWLVAQGDSTYLSTVTLTSYISIDYDTGSTGAEFDGLVWSSSDDYLYSIETATLTAATQKDVLGFEFPTPATAVINCRLEPNEAIAGLGEIGLWAEVTYSSTPPEVGTRFMLAVAHFGLQTKTRRQAILYRFVVQF